ncbi:MAG: phytoene/squalene synthase family protein [Aigarchaeota archaeon]|nr:phytoene/squalene synthase family protein [Aigarchaeota archaeon]MDW8093292.1 phytoene/squalene synthase family protein [Nitrososphaerota archaeon]
MLNRDWVPVDPVIYRIFKQGSMTYFNSALFFPPEVRTNVFKLYAFLRKADDFVDRVPPDVKGFYEFRREYEKAESSGETKDVVIKNFLDLSRERNFDTRWVMAFLDAMEMDLYKKTYSTLDELLHYMYGSAEVVGLFMARILGLSEESFIYARHQGRAMQYINFIRDVQEDLELGRQYLPLEDLRRYGLNSLDPKYFSQRREAFSRFIREQIKRYLEWQRFAERGYIYIPYRYLIPIKTASDMYKDTAKIIYRNPWIVFQRKVKPQRSQIVYKAYANLVCAIRYKLPWGAASCT